MGLKSVPPHPGPACFLRIYMLYTFQLDLIFLIRSVSMEFHKMLFLKEYLDEYSFEFIVM